MHNEKCSVCWGDNPNWIQHFASTPCSCPEFDGGGLETYVDDPEDSEEVDLWEQVLDDDSYEDESEEESEQILWVGSAAAEPIALLTHGHLALLRRKMRETLFHALSLQIVSMKV